MHECPYCGEACDCIDDDRWDPMGAMYCEHECDIDYEEDCEDDCDADEEDWDGYRHDDFNV